MCWVLHPSGVCSCPFELVDKLSYNSPPHQAPLSTEFPNLRWFCLLQNGLVSVAASTGSVLTQHQANGLNNGPFSGLGANSGSPASSKVRRPVAPDNDWLSSPSPSGGAPSLTPSPGPPSHAFTVISNGYSSPLSSGSYDPYSPNGKIGKCSLQFLFGCLYQTAVFFFLLLSDEYHPD